MTMAAAMFDEAETVPGDGHTPLRRCLASGQSLPRARLLRFVVGPDDVVVPDPEARLPGRGLWVSCHRDMVETACAKGLFSRAARRSVTPLVGAGGESLAERVETLLAGRVLDSLAMARKAGRFVFGLARVTEAVDRLARRGPGAGGPAILLRARDAGADGRSVSARFAATLPEPFARIEALDAAELARIAGREHVVHALVLPGGTARQALRAANRLAAYRGVLPLEALESDPLDGQAGATEDDVTGE